MPCPRISIPSTGGTYSSRTAVTEEPAKEKQDDLGPQLPNFIDRARNARTFCTHNHICTRSYNLCNIIHSIRNFYHINCTTKINNYIGCTNNGSKTASQYTRTKRISAKTKERDFYSINRRHI